MLKEGIGIYFETSNKEKSCKREKKLVEKKMILKVTKWLF